MEERRLLLAVALSLLVLTAYQLLFPAKPVPRPSPAGTPAAGDAAPAPVPPPSSAPGASPAPAAAPTAAPPRPVVADERERRVEVVGADFTAAFSNRGARLLSWQLATFKDRRGR